MSTGLERAVLVQPGAVCAVVFHPFAPMLACGDSGGNVHLARLIGIELGPLVVTARDQSRGLFRADDLTVRCPACRDSFPVTPAQLGTQLTCPNSACGRALRLNQFTLH